MQAGRELCDLGRSDREPEGRSLTYFWRSSAEAAAEEQQGWRAALLRGVLPVQEKGRNAWGEVGLGWVGLPSNVCVFVQQGNQRVVGIPARKVEAGTWQHLPSGLVSECPWKRSTCRWSLWRHPHIFAPVTQFSSHGWIRDRLFPLPLVQQLTALQVVGSPQVLW